ncbi:MAG: inositol monophosphatase family protein [Bacteroidales bacterium]
MDYKGLCDEVIGIAVEAGQYIMERMTGFSMNQVEVKGKNNFVTEVDKAAEGMIVERLRKLVNGAGFIAEEGTAQSRGEKYNWIIDPLDGTTNFIHHAPPVAVSIALTENDLPVIGVVYEVWLKEAFYAWKGGGAYLNGKEIRVSDTAEMKDALIAVGFPYHGEQRRRVFIQSLDHFLHATHGVRRLGSAATDLAYVACGRYEGFYEYNLAPWDVAAGAIIITEAGGKVSDFSGKNNFLFGKEIVASNNRVFAEFLNDVAQFMKP